MGNFCYGGCCVYGVDVYFVLWCYLVVVDVFDWVVVVYLFDCCYCGGYCCVWVLFLIGVVFGCGGDFVGGGGYEFWVVVVLLVVGMG